MTAVDVAYAEVQRITRARAKNFAYGIPEDRGLARDRCQGNQRGDEARLRAAAQGHSRLSTAANVSIDFNHDPHRPPALDQTKVKDGKLVRVMSWYDNEWGFSNRMADTAVAFGKLI